MKSDTNIHNPGRLILKANKGDGSLLRFCYEISNVLIAFYHLTINERLENIELEY